MSLNITFTDLRFLIFKIFTLIVMGAGVADPETISEDVIFPNYNWPNLTRVKEEWNVTTFVVLSTQMIKDMKDMESYNGTIIISK